MTLVSDWTEEDGSVVINLTSWRQKSLSSCARDTERSGLLKGSQRKAPMGRGEIGGGIFSSSGSTQEVQEEWTPMWRLQRPEIVLSMLKKDTMLNLEIHHPTYFRWQVNVFTQRSSWLGIMTATTIWRFCKDPSWAMMVDWSCQNVDVVLASLKRSE